LAAGSSIGGLPGPLRFWAEAVNWARASDAPAAPVLRDSLFLTISAHLGSTSNMGFSMSHWAKNFHFGPEVPDSFLPVNLLTTVTCSSSDKFDIQPVRLLTPLDPGDLPMPGEVEVAVALVLGVTGRSGTTPIWASSHFCTLASDGESGRPSRSCNLLKSGIFPTESAPFLSRLCPGATPPWGSSFSRVTPLAAPRPNMMSSSLFFFLLLSSVVPSANFLLFCKPSLSKADSNLDGGLLEEVLVWPAAFRFCKSAINELVSEASPLTGVISIPEIPRFLVNLAKTSSLSRSSCPIPGGIGLFGRACVKSCLILLVDSTGKPW